MSLRRTLRSLRKRPTLSTATGSDFESIRKEVSADLALGVTTVVVTGGRRSGKTSFCELVARFVDPRSFPFVIATPPDSFDTLTADVLRRCGFLDDVQSHPPLSHETLAGVLESFLTSIASLQGRVVLVFDDAHKLRAPLVEQVLQLTAFRPEGRGAVQVLFVGEPSLIALLGADSLRNLRPFISRPHQLPRVARTAMFGAHASQRMRRIPPRLWLASTASALLASVALALTSASQHDIVPSAKAASGLEHPTRAGYVPPAISPAPADGLASDQSADPPGQADRARLLAARVSPKPATLDARPVPLADVLRQAEALSEEPDVKGLARLREDVAARATQSIGNAERQALEPILKALDRKLDEARQLQLEVDRRRLAAGVRSGADPQTPR